MNRLIILLSVVGFAVAQWGGHAPGLPADTPEVAAAKAAHLAALAQVNNRQHQSSWSQPQQQWSQPQQQQQWGQPQQQWSQSPQPKWNGPLALPPGFDQTGAPLPVRDTPEVAAEKARHFDLYANSGRLSAQPTNNNQWNAQPNQWNQHNQWNAQPNQWNQQNQWNSQPNNQWNSQSNQWNQQPNPLWNAQPANNNGLPADTPEVAAAKAAHLAAHSQLGTQGAGHWGR